MPIRVASTVYGPPMRMPGSVHRPSELVNARYSVPEGRCVALTRAPASGMPVESVTDPRMEPVVTCANAFVEQRDPAATSAANRVTVRRLRNMWCPLWPLGSTFFPREIM